MGRRRITEGFESQLRAWALHWPLPHAGCEEAVYEMQTLVEGYVALETRLGTREQRRFPPEYPSEGVAIRDAAAGIAASERNRMSLGQRPVGFLRDRSETDCAPSTLRCPASERACSCFPRTKAREWRTTRIIRKNGVTGPWCTNAAIS